MSRAPNDEALTVASGQGLQGHTRDEHDDCHDAPAAEQVPQAIDADREFFETFRAAAGRKGIAVYELANGEALVCKWGLSRSVPIDALAAFMASMGVHV